MFFNVLALLTRLRQRTFRSYVPGTLDFTHGFKFALREHMLTDPFRTNRITSTIIGAAIRVHRATGPGLLESAYFPCLLFELQEAGLVVFPQYPIPLTYRGIRLDAGYRADMLVDDTVVVELKSVEALAPIHTAQMLTYLKLSAKPAGLLINFNVPVVKDGIRRVLNAEMLKTGEASPEPVEENGAKTFDPSVLDTRS